MLEKLIRRIVIPVAQIDIPGAVAPPNATHQIDPSPKEQPSSQAEQTQTTVFLPAAASSGGTSLLSDTIYTDNITTEILECRM